MIAGPEMEGRETSTNGQRRAAAYIENEMRTIGLAPGNGPDYQMIYPLYSDSMELAAISINGQPLEWKKSFTVRSENYTANQSFSEAVYADGYGAYSFKTPEQSQIDRTVTHRRSVLFIKPAYWLVLDEMQDRGDECFIFQQMINQSLSPARSLWPDVELVAILRNVL